MQHFIFNLADGDRERAKSFLHAKRWVVSRDERHRDALAPGDLALVFVARTREFVGRAELKTTFLDPMPSDPAASGPAVSGVLLGDVEDWSSGVPLEFGPPVRVPGLGSWSSCSRFFDWDRAGCRLGQVQLVRLGDAAGDQRQVLTRRALRFLQEIRPRRSVW